MSFDWAFMSGSPRPRPATPEPPDYEAILQHHCPDEWGELQKAIEAEHTANREFGSMHGRVPTAANFTSSRLKRLRKALEKKGVADLKAVLDYALKGAPAYATGRQQAEEETDPILRRYRRGDRRRS